MKPKDNILSKAECSAMRGIAILGIMLHNYCHWLNFAVKENEYQFHSDRAAAFWQSLTTPDGMLPIQLLSFLGHYGVPVFLFLSGYGLVLKYERENEPSYRPLPFIKFHYLKLLRMMIPGFIFFIIIDIITPRSFHFYCPQLLEQGLMVINIFPDPARWIWPGPYWFFGLMLQLYIIYRLLLFRRHWGWTAGLILVCFIAQMACSPDGDTLKYLRYNSIGGILPFGLGILTARYLTHFRINISRWQWTILCLVLSAAIVVMSLYEITWYFVPVVIILATIAMVKALPSWLMSWMIWTGGISAAMFVTHPAMRKIFIPVSHRGDVYDGLMLYVIAAIGVAWAFTLLIQKIQKPLLK